MNKIYFYTVFEEGYGVIMVVEGSPEFMYNEGKYVVRIDAESLVIHTNNTQEYKEKFKNDTKRTCLKHPNDRRNYRASTDKEKAWLEACKKKGCYVSFESITSNYLNYEIY